MLWLPLPADPHSLAFSPDGRLLAVGGDPFVRLFDSFAGRLERVLTADDGYGPAYALAFSPDGLRLAARHTFAVHVWSVSAGRWLCELPVSLVPPAFLPCGKRLVTVGGMSDPAETRPEWCRLWFWAALSGELLRTRVHAASGPLLWPVAVAAAGPLEVVTADRLRRFDPDTGTELDGVRLPAGLTATAARHTAGGWVVRTERPPGRWLGRRRPGLGVIDADGFRTVGDGPGDEWAASADGTLVARADGDTVRTQPLGGGGTALDPGVGRVRAVGFSPDGLRQAAAGRRAAAVWDADG